MKLGSLFAAAALALLPAAARSAVVQYEAPAAALAAGPLGNAVYAAVLPSGRIVTPTGQSVVSGVGAWGFGLTADDRYAIVSNDDARYASVRSAVDARVSGGFALAVIDTATMQVVDDVSLPGETYSGGLVVQPDPRVPGRSLVFAAGGASQCVYAFDLDASGRLTPDLHHVIAIAAPLAATLTDRGGSFPTTLVAAPDGARVYAVDESGAGVSAIDTATRAVVGPSVAVGFAPGGAALAGDQLLVANGGLLRAGPLADAPLAPPFGLTPPDPLHASSLSLVGLGSGIATALAMDAPLDGLVNVGGAHPAALVVTPAATNAYVAMSNVDRIATVRLGAAPLVVGGTELRLFDRGPYGTQPGALALSADGTRLYVALTGIDAVAVLDAHDPLHLHRLGLIPTGWLPSALALSRDDRTLYVLNTNGFGHDGGTRPDAPAGAGSRPVWSTLQKIDLSAINLSASTLTALRDTRATRSAPPLYPHALRNVVIITAGSATFDAALGDLGYGPANAADVVFGAALTPNLHALARRFALAGNMYVEAEEPELEDALAAGGIATLAAQRHGRFATGAQAPLGRPEDPAGYPRAGYLVHRLAADRIAFREYGGLVRLGGYDDGEAADPLRDDPLLGGPADPAAATQGLGGRYTESVPAPAVLAGNIDLNYPGWNLRISNERRAAEFVRDYAALVAAHRQPRYTHVWLPAGTGGDLPAQEQQALDGDRALGKIVSYLSQLSSWKHTAIIVMPDTARFADHIDANRSYALVISPFAKRHYVGMRHLCTPSVLKTSEQLLHVPPLALGDLLATDMSDFFSAVPDPRPFTATNGPLPAPFTQR